MARDELVKKDKKYPRTMERVFKAEDAVAQLREELAALETELNEEDAEWKAMEAAHEAERHQLQDTQRRYQKAVDAILGKSKDLRKKITEQKAAIQYDSTTMSKAEQRHADLELQTNDEYKLDQSKSMVKRI